ncbi:E domain-containing protein [Staphylococcus aureus]
MAPGHRDEFDPKLPTGEKKKFQVNQELKSETGDVVRPRR